MVIKLVCITNAFVPAARFALAATWSLLAAIVATKTFPPYAFSAASFNSTTDDCKTFKASVNCGDARPWAAINGATVNLTITSFGKSSAFEDNC